MTKKQSKLALALVVGVGATLTVLLGVLGAVEVDDSCISGDGNATCVEGNLALGSASCALFSTPNGETKYWIGQENSSGDSDGYVTATSFGTYLNITSVTPPAVILGSVIKAGTAYNVYYGAVLSGLNAPQNKGGQEPEISHWTVCYYVPEDTTTTTEATTTTAQVTTSTAPERTTTTQSSTTTTPEQTTTTPSSTTSSSTSTSTTTPEQTTTTSSTSTTLVIDTTTTSDQTTTTEEATTTSTSTPPATSTSTTEATTTTTDPETSTSGVSETTVSGPTSTTTAEGETTTTAEGDSETLPRTGPSSTVLLLLLGSGLVGLGYALLATTKNSPSLSD